MANSINDSNKVKCNNLNSFQKYLMAKTESNNNMILSLNGILGSTNCQFGMTGDGNENFLALASMLEFDTELNLKFYNQLKECGFLKGSLVIELLNLNDLCAVTNIKIFKNSIEPRLVTDGQFDENGKCHFFLKEGEYIVVLYIKNQKLKYSISITNEDKKIEIKI